MRRAMETIRRKKIARKTKNKRLNSLKLQLQSIIAKSCSPSVKKMS